jgi:hypothetical protein
MKIPIDPPPWEGRAAVMACWEEGGYRRFALAGRTDIVSCQVADGELVVFPERSSAHKALIVALQPQHSPEPQEQ